MGAYHLMCNAIHELKSKGTIITDEEEQAVKIAILLHDLGHGPYSHALENTLIKGISQPPYKLLYLKDHKNILHINFEVLKLRAQ